VKTLVLNLPNNDGSSRWKSALNSNNFHPVCLQMPR
jgi:hypothetical protein